MTDDGQSIDRLVEAAKSQVMTAAELQGQRRSWLRGLLGTEHPDWTPEAIDVHIDQLAPMPLPAAIDLTEGLMSERQARETYGVPPIRLSKAIVDIVAERVRQITGEGWSAEHDDKHADGELAAAASTYAYVASVFPHSLRAEHCRAVSEGASGLISVAAAMWPWEINWFKPKDRRRDLVRAGALIVAEIERMDRAIAKRAAEPRSSERERYSPFRGGLARNRAKQGEGVER